MSMKPKLKTSRNVITTTRTFLCSLCATKSVHVKDEVFDMSDKAKKYNVRNNILDSIGMTPLVKIRRIHANGGVNIYAKVEGQNPTGSVKDRIALKMIEQAEEEGDLYEGKIIIEATSGNTGIGLAMVGVVKGYPVTIVMSEAVSVERRKVIKAFGAKIILTPKDSGTDGAIRRVRELVKRYPDKYFHCNQFANKYNKLAHYRTTGQEIWEQMNGKIDFFVSCIGTSGTLMGVGMYLKEKNKDVQVVEAHPEKGHYIQGLKNMEEAIVPALYDTSNIDISIKVDTEHSFEMARQIVKKEGIFVGMSSGAALLAAVEIAKRIKDGKLKGKNIVVIFPDRGEKYLSTNLFKV